MSSGHQTSKRPPDRARPLRAQSKDRDLGEALRSVYMDAIDEAVPDDLLDLLKKLD